MIIKSLPEEPVNEIGDIIANAEKSEFETKQFADYKDQFQWFLGIGLLFLLIDVVLFDKKTKWLIYTVLVGLIPILSRIFVWSVTEAGVVSLIMASDFIAFGLILHISNINEIEHLADDEKSWKTVQNGVSIAFIAFYSVLFALIMISDLSFHIIDTINQPPNPTKCTNKFNGYI